MVHTLRYTNIAMENRPGLKMYLNVFDVFPIENGDIPAIALLIYQRVRAFFAP